VTETQRRQSGVWEHRVGWTCGIPLEASISTGCCAMSQASAAWAVQGVGGSLYMAPHEWDSIGVVGKEELVENEAAAADICHPSFFCF